MTPGLFITGTDTGVGKTYVAALIAKSLAQAGHRVGVYKPAASGCRREGNELISDDALALWEAAGRPADLAAVCPQRFIASLAPHLAARSEGTHVDPELLRTGVEFWRERSDIVIVEGAGGLMSPISDDDYVADLAQEFGYPLVVVAPNRIGVINQTSQTLIVAKTFRAGIPVAGIVLNDVGAGDDPSQASNYDELCRHCVSPVLTSLDYQARDFTREVDWSAMARAR